MGVGYPYRQDEDDNDDEWHVWLTVFNLWLSCFILSNNLISYHRRSSTTSDSSITNQHQDTQMRPLSYFVSFFFYKTCIIIFYYTFSLMLQIRFSLGLDSSTSTHHKCDDCDPSISRTNDTSSGAAERTICLVFFLFFFFVSVFFIIHILFFHLQYILLSGSSSSPHVMLYFTIHAARTASR